MSPIDRLNIIADIPTLDAVAAFDYYIQNFNYGRSFILAGHSRGSDVLSNLLAVYMKAHPVVLARMIAAYVIGFPITAEYLADNPHLKFAEGPGDTGVIISYNTEAPDVPPRANPVLSGLILDDLLAGQGHLPRERELWRPGGARLDPGAVTPEALRQR